ncbi:MAG: hypothetical protein ACYS47_02085 [Planctomycetota bacterium]|jgi:hypothetical protein
MARDDPFELLKKKLAAKKKAGRKPGSAGGASQRPPGAPPPKPKSAAPRRPAGAPPPVSKPAASRRPAGGGSWLDSAAGPAAKGKPRRVVRKEGAGGAAGVKKPLKIIRTAWSAEDLDRMRKSKETTKDGPPAGFTSHRYDSGIDPKRARARKKASKEPGRRPRGFRSDRADRK